MPICSFSEPEPEPVEEVPVATGPGKSAEGEFQLKSWPPVASNQNPNQIRKGTVFCRHKK